MYFGIAAALTEAVRENAQDDVTRTTYSLIHTVLCAGAAVQSFKALNFSIRRTAKDVSDTVPHVAAVTKAARQVA